MENANPPPTNNPPILLTEHRTQVDTPLVSPFLDLDDDSNDGEVLNELEEYGNAGQLCRQREINSFDGDDLAYNIIMVEKLESKGRNLVAIVRDVYACVGSFTYITNFVVLEDIGEFILRDMSEVVMGKAFRKVTKLEYDSAKGLMSFTRIFDNYTFQMPRTIPRNEVIMEYLVKISKKAGILELKRRNMKITVLTTNTPYPSRKIPRIYA
ncbi:hypothetical protein Tco_1188357 [Tanacetum coccineum]